MFRPTRELLEALECGAFDRLFAALYPPLQEERQLARYKKAVAEFERIYGNNREVTLFSAPGRTEIGGNHTDHQRGRVLAAAVNLDILCIVAKNEDNAIRIKSEGYEADVVALDSLAVHDSEKNRAIALIRGIAARFRQLGYEIGGFDAYTTSDVLKGSGLSSSAAFEVAVGTILSHIFNAGRVSAARIAQIGQYAENVYFGKPCGLMDQMASSVGGFVLIDFKDSGNPLVEPVIFDFSKTGHTLCIVDTKGSHSGLTGEYAAIPAEMHAVASFFGQAFLSGVDESAFWGQLPELHNAVSDRAILRAMHFFSENARVLHQVKALRAADFVRFKALVLESGRSSSELLQNVFATPIPTEQGVPLALAASERLLSPDGAWRVHGGGFAGTIQAFAPNEKLPAYRSFMEKLFGAGACYELMIRPVGGAQIREDATWLN